VRLFKNTPAKLLLCVIIAYGGIIRANNATLNSLDDLVRSGTALEPGVYRASPRSLRFTQSDASPFFSKGGRIDDLVRDLRAGRVSPEAVGDGPIQVVQRGDRLFSLDNRRLAAFQQAGIDDIPIEIVSLRNPVVNRRFFTRFDPIDGEGLQLVLATSKQREAAQRLLVQYRKIKGIQLPR